MTDLEQWGLASIVGDRQAEQMARQAKEEEPERPVVILYGWMYFGGALHATRVENHPELGNITCKDGEVITTSRVVWIDELIGCAKTQNTFYLLRERAKL